MSAAHLVLQDITQRQTKQPMFVKKTGKLRLKITSDREKQSEVFLKLLYTDSDVHVQIYTDPKKTILFGNLSPLKYDIEINEQCQNTLTMTKRAKPSGGTLQCVTLIARNPADATEWAHALSYKPPYMNISPASSPAQTKKYTQQM